MSTCKYLTNITVYPQSAEQSQETRDEALKIYSKADGLLRAYYGTQVEDPTISYWIFEWESEEHEANFLKDETLQQFFQKLQENVVEGTVNLRIQFQSTDQAAVFTAPTTEICIATLKPGVDSQKFFEIAGNEAHQDPKSVPGMTAYAWGQVIGNESQYIFAVGWDSLEAHKEILSTRDGLKEAMSKIGEICDLELRHVNLKIQNKI